VCREREASGLRLVGNVVVVVVVWVVDVGADFHASHYIVVEVITSIYCRVNHD